jgi:Type IV secretion system pilin
MKYFYNNLFGFCVLVSILTLPALTFADMTTNTFTSGTVNTNTSATTCAPGAFCLGNPVSQFGTFCSLLKAIFNDILILGIPIATLLIVWAGFKLVLARGNSEALNTARRNLWYIIIGIAVFLGAWTLSQIIASTLSTFGAGGGLC